MSPFLIWMPRPFSSLTLLHLLSCFSGSVVTYGRVRVGSNLARLMLIPAAERLTGKRTTVSWSRGATPLFGNVFAGNFSRTSSSYRSYVCMAGSLFSFSESHKVANENFLALLVIFTMVWVFDSPFS
ncbi:amino acid permease [Histoplasma capsulatum var. duboisii H88]|uniref:Amino acid permease n=1 Tax=Ajellomyces capsulatus (strain H88) TaxID=544711 RepID=A0A8A1LKC7_AJEC8|nr:amino acid permease [Histoplasma capsulatum var. duboisii H88]